MLHRIVLLPIEPPRFNDLSEPLLASLDENSYGGASSVSPSFTEGR